MIQAVPLSFSEWESFYVIVGSSAAALTGLQFVVIALGADMESIGSHDAINAFATPTVVHFCLVLFVAAVLSAPWHSYSGAALGLGVSAVFGLVYTAIVLRRARRQAGYTPVLEDWLWHIIFPPVAYAMMLAGALLLAAETEPAHFLVAAASLFLLYIGIHNAWDAATWMAVEQRTRKKRSEG